MRAVRPRVAQALVVLVGLLVLAGCGSGVDLAKVTFERTTVPASAGSPDSIDPDAVDNLSADRLRLIDPCALLDLDTLARLGEPDENVAQDYHRCRNYMRDADGQSLSMSLRVGESVGTAELRAEESVGPFLLHESEVEGACFLTLVLDNLEPPLGVGLQVSYKSADDPCETAHVVIASVAQRLVSPDSVRTPEPGSLMDVDPCAFVQDRPAEAVDGATTPSPYGLHQCQWRNPDGVLLELRFGGDRYDPGVGDEDRRGEEMDLGEGVTGYLSRGGSLFPTCELAWLHRAIDGDKGEVITIDVRDVRNTELDICAAAVTFGTSIVPILPSP